MTRRLDRRAVRRALLVAVLVTSAATLAGCSASRTADDDVPPLTQPQEHSLVVVGDSITFMSREAIRSRLEALGLTDVTIDAQVGRRIAVGRDGQPYAGTEVVDFITDSGRLPDAWVIALGTNDVGQYTSADEYRRVVDELLAPIPADAPLVWVDVYHRPQLDQAEVFDEVVRDAIGERGDDGVVADWASRAEGDGVVVDDGVHPTPAGIELFADTIASAVDRLLSR